MQSTTTRRIPVSGPSITQKEIDYVTSAVTHGWYERANEYQERFERAMAEYCGVRHAVALPSCTSAIHLALAAADVGAGDEVVVPDITWIATSAPIHYVGAQPVFADVDPRTWCVSVESLRQCLSGRTRAVIAVDLYGNIPRMDAVVDLAHRQGALVIEDAAEAFGSQRSGRRAGSLGDIGVFSFHGSKTATTGEGGMLVTDCDDIHRRVLLLRDHGRRPGDFSFFHEQIAFKYKMSCMQAALGLAQVERADELVEQKRRVFEWYHELLRDTEGIELNRSAADTFSTYWMVTLLVAPELGIRKQELAEQLARRNIDTRPFFHPLSSLPAYRGTKAARDGARRNSVAYELSPRGINLPSGLNLSREDVRYVAQSVREIIQEARRGSSRSPAA
jgi:perosamine synthetase